MRSSLIRVAVIAVAAAGIGMGLTTGVAAANSGSYHCDEGFGQHEWDSESGVVFRMDQDVFGTVGGVPMSQYTAPEEGPVPPLNLC